MEQPRDCIGVRIHPGQVCALVEIALVASPGQIGQIVRATVLTSLDVLGVKRMIRIVALSQMVILTAIIRPLPHPRASPGVHQAAGC